MASHGPPPQPKKAKDNLPGLLMDEMDSQPSLPQLTSPIPYVPDGVLMDEFASQISPLTVQPPLPNTPQPLPTPQTPSGIDLTPPPGDTLLGLAVRLEDDVMKSQEFGNSSKDKGNFKTLENIYYFNNKPYTNLVSTPEDPIYWLLQGGRLPN